MQIYKKYLLVYKRIISFLNDLMFIELLVENSRISTAFLMSLGEMVSFYSYK